MELRMYGLVNYQLIGIQKGIQYGHGKDEYTLAMIDMLENGFNNLDVYKQYKEWLKFHKTYIILNGGTTNNNPKRLGTLNKHLNTLKEQGIYCTTFYEPDLGDQLTSINFIVDERVFGKDDNKQYKWKNFKDWLLDNPSAYIFDIKSLPFFDKKTSEIEDMFKTSTLPEYTDLYNQWVLYMGGYKNAFLRRWLENFNLA